LANAPSFAQRRLHHEGEASANDRPWMNSKLSPDERAEMVLKELTLDEKINLVHGQGMPGWHNKVFPNAALGNGGAGFVLGAERLGIPMIQISDAAYGVRSSADNGRYSTALPSNIASAATWDPQAACEYGALIGRELVCRSGKLHLFCANARSTRRPTLSIAADRVLSTPVLTLFSSKRTFHFHVPGLMPWTMLYSFPLHFKLTDDATSSSGRPPC